MRSCKQHPFQQADRDNQIAISTALTDCQKHSLQVFLRGVSLTWNTEKSHCNFRLRLLCFWIRLLHSKKNRIVLKENITFIWKHAFLEINWNTTYVISGFKTLRQRTFLPCIFAITFFLWNYTRLVFSWLLNSQLVSTLSVFLPKPTNIAHLHFAKSAVLIKAQRKPAAISRTDHLAL